MARRDPQIETGEIAAAAGDAPFWSAVVPEATCRLELTPHQRVYLALTQGSWPEFWRALNRAWRSGSSAEVAHWFKQYQVDDEWLVQTVRYVLQEWTDHPDEPAAKLVEFDVWSKLPPQHIPEFAPHFVEPKPKAVYRKDAIPGDGKGPSVRLETLDEFANRMGRQFTKDMTAYKRRLKPMFADFRGDLLRDAEWTVLNQSGVSYAQIARQTKVRGNEPVAAVRMAVERFRREIGLTGPASKLRRQGLPNS